MIVESFFIGLVIGFLFYEIVGVSPGGVIAPAYFALFIHQPGKIAVTVLITIVVWLIILFLSRWLIVYGRRKLLIALILGFLFKLLFEFKLVLVFSFALLLLYAVDKYFTKIEIRKDCDQMSEAISLTERWFNDVGQMKKEK